MRSAPDARVKPMRITLTRTDAMRAILDGDATLDGWRTSRGLDVLGDPQ